MSSIKTADILMLSVSERILLVEDIWDSIENAPENVSITEAQELELEARLDAFHRDPSRGSPWAMVKDRFQAQRAP